MIIWRWRPSPDNGSETERFQLRRSRWNASRGILKTAVGHQVSPTVAVRVAGRATIHTRIQCVQLITRRQWRSRSVSQPHVLLRGEMLALALPRQDMLPEYHRWENDPGTLLGFGNQMPTSYRLLRPIGRDSSSQQHRSASSQADERLISRRDARRGQACPAQAAVRPE